MKKLSAERDAAKQVRKFTSARIQAALDALEKKSLDEATVHFARKSLKRARMGLRLLRPALADADYRAANAALRDAARPLGSLRDAYILLETLTQLLSHPDRPGHPIQPESLKRLLRQNLRRLRQRVLGDGRILAHSRHLLRATLASMRRSELQHSDWELLGPSLERLYRKARRAHRTAFTCGTAEALHEWRKQVKYFRYALEILRPLWPAVIGAWAQQTHELADALGDSHDLTVLCEMTLAHPEALLSPRQLDALLALSEHRQQQLTRTAGVLGARLFEEKPRTFTSRLEKYWRQWVRIGVTPAVRHH